MLFGSFNRANDTGVVCGDIHPADSEHNMTRMLSVGSAATWLHGKCRPAASVIVVA